MSSQLRSGAQPAQSAQPEPSTQTLWSTAPGWRRLVIGSTMLTSLAASAPAWLPHSDTLSGAPAVGSKSQSVRTQQGCAAQMPSLLIPDAPQHLMARVISTISSESVLAATARVEARLGVKVNPAYLDWPHVDTVTSLTGMETIAAVPPAMSVKVGDLVELNSRYRDHSLPCQFIPWTVNRVVER